MSKNYQPQGVFNVPFQLLKRKLVDVPGVLVATYEESIKSKCSCITYSTSDTTVNTLQTSQDTWNFETHYTPLIQKGDRIRLLDDNSEYDIVGVPENVRRENRYLKCKLVRING